MSDQADLMNILIVDDNKNNLFTLHTLIDEHINAQILEAESGAIALQILLQEKIDLIILDVQMPEMDGFETAQLIRSRKKTQHIPIVFLTAAYKSEQFKQKGFAVGAADYLTKPIDANQLISRIQSYLRFIQQERQHNQELERKVRERTAELLESNEKLKQEINERKLVEAKLQEAREQLEQRVQERTAELLATNQRLQAEINERKQIEMALERLSHQTQLILESAGEGILGLDLTGQLILVNPAAARMLGYEQNEIIGQLQYEIIYHTKADGTRYSLEESPICNALQAGQVCHRDDEIFRRKDGTSFTAEYITTPIREANQVTGAVMTFRDVTERKQAEMALQEAKMTAEAANLAKSQFLANMSHELRTPLNAIIGYSEMLKEEAVDLEPEDFIPDLERIHAAGNHLLGLINDVLDLSKIEAGKMELHLESFTLSALLQEVISTVQPLIEKNTNTLEIICTEPLGEMYADMTKLRQILFNLLSNAAKFTENGLIFIEVNRQQQDDEDWIYCRVADDGIGITHEQRAKLFRAFTQADASTTRKYGGTGLGLAITKQFVEMMGGRIDLISAFGQGSLFTIKLPTVVNPSEDRQQTEYPLAITEEEGIILVIDDDNVTRALLKNYLTQLGYAVAVAAGGKEGLRLARKLRPDAIVLDVKMPNIDGWKVLSWLKSDSLLADIPVVMISVEDQQKKGVALGATDYLLKPVYPEQLSTILRKFKINYETQNLVMLVEDDIVIREMMADILKNQGWQVFKAENGQVALNYLDRKNPALILLDLMMPIMDGFEFLTHLRAHESLRSIPVVVLTALPLTAEEEARLQGVETIFQKATYNQDELLLQIHQLISQSKTPTAHETTIFRRSN
ncbi:PAS domain S-box [Thioploca ingrica]|uniref:histidine kinase n=1 Tax=Thioploca ingrica TaxID=40754 RepID=A0A090BVC0_9GAMM|nr:PAS domain S-box [Thioploca ingrica]